MCTRVLVRARVYVQLSPSVIMIIYCRNKSQEEKSTCLKEIYLRGRFLSSAFTMLTPILPSFTNHFIDLHLKG